MISGPGLNGLMDRVITINPSAKAIRVQGNERLHYDVYLSGRGVRLTPIWEAADPTGRSTIAADSQVATLALAARLPIYRWRDRSNREAALVPASPGINPLDLWIDVVALPAATRLFHLATKLGFNMVLQLALARGCTMEKNQ